MTRNEFFDSLEREFGHLSPRENILASKAYSVAPEKAEREMAKLKYQLSLTRGEKAICLEIDGKDMTDVYKLQQEIKEKDVIINFLKKELQHKISYRQAMKKQYRELKQKYESEKEKPVNVLELELALKVVSEELHKKDSKIWELTEKIEKMKNCDNCKHSHVCNTGLVMELDRKNFGEPCNKCKDYSKWEIKNV